MTRTFYVCFVIVYEKCVLQEKGYFYVNSTTVYKYV